MDLFVLILSILSLSKGKLGKDSPYNKLFKGSTQFSIISYTSHNKKGTVALTANFIEILQFSRLRPVAVSGSPAAKTVSLELLGGSLPVSAKSSPLLRDSYPFKWPF